MWCCVDVGLTEVSEERIASIFRVEKSASRELAMFNYKINNDIIITTI
jgi:hypothetical protein